MRRPLTGALLALLVAMPVAGEAQSARGQASRPRPRPSRSVGARVYGVYGGVALASADTFEAVADTSRTTTVGGGVQVTRLWRDLFVDVSLHRHALDGERVFVSDGTVYPLGIPLDVTFQPIDVSAGWRLSMPRYSPYVGLGLSSIGYRETSPFAQAGDDVDERATGVVILAGVDVVAWRFLSIGGELRYRLVNGVLGEGGASAIYGEEALGGVQYALRLSIGR